MNNDSGDRTLAALDELVTESALRESAGLEELDAAAFVRLANRENARVGAALDEAAGAIARAIEGIVERWNEGGRILYVGAGTSGRLGVLDASECPPTFGVAPERVVGVIAGGDRALRTSVEGAEDDEAGAVSDLDELALTQQDTVVGLSASGRTPYVRSALEHARQRGAWTVAIVCNANSVVAAASEVPIEVVVGPEIVVGSTRLKAGTAQKLVLNLLSTGVLVQTGHTRDGRMTNLVGSNSKLAERAARILAARTGTTLEEARTRLAQHSGSLAAALSADETP